MNNRCSRFGGTVSITKDLNEQSSIGSKFELSVRINVPMIISHTASLRSRRDHFSPLLSLLTIASILLDQLAHKPPLHDQSDMKLSLLLVSCLIIVATAEEFKVVLQIVDPCESLHEVAYKDLAWYHYEKPSCDDKMNNVFWRDVEKLKECHLHRSIRSIAAAATVGGFFKQIGQIGIKAVTNLIDSQSSSAAYDDRFEDVEREVRHFKNTSEFNSRMINEFYDYLQAISPATETHRTVLREIAGNNPLESRFGVARVNAGILTRAADMEAIAEKCRVGKMATVELGELTGNLTISRIDPESTKLTAVEVRRRENKVLFTFDAPLPGRETVKVSNKQTVANQCGEQGHFDKYFLLEFLIKIVTDLIVILTELFIGLLIFKRHLQRFITLIDGVLDKMKSSAPEVAVSNSNEAAQQRSSRVPIKQASKAVWD
jgi:hypothetical protein